MTDAVNHFAGIFFFITLDCSQAYHCVQLAVPSSVQLLSFNFANRTFAFKPLAQGLSKSVTGFSSFIRSFFDTCITSDLCIQFMDDIGAGVTKFEEMIPNLRRNFECLRSSGLILSPKKCQFGMPSTKFLGNTITEKELQLEKENIQKILRNMRMP